MLEHLGLGNAVKVKALLGLQGVDWIKWRQPCKSWLYVTYWGISTKVTTVWIVLGVSEAVYWAFVLASIVTLGRCGRCWSGVLSRNPHRGSINLWCPADKRPTDRWMGGLSPGDIPRAWVSSHALGWIFAKRSLPPSGSAVVHKLPPAPGWRWATTNAPWANQGAAGGMVVCQAAWPKRE